MILEFEKYRTDLEALRAKLHDVGDGLHIDHMQQELTELHEEQGEPGFWDNLERSTHVTRKISQLEAKIKHYEGLVSQCDDIEVMMELAEEADDASVVPEVSEMLEKLRNDTDALELETLMRGQYDDHDAVLSLHAGAGGTEAQDWTSMLYRMYTRYCERMGFTVKLLDILDEYDAKCTFFLVGLWVDKYPDMVQAIVERGHEIGNHSATHPHMSKLSESKMLEELRMMSDKVEKLTGVRPTLFRPPYGDYNNSVIRTVRSELDVASTWTASGTGPSGGEAVRRRPSPPRGCGSC